MNIFRRLFFFHSTIKNILLKTLSLSVLFFFVFSCSSCAKKTDYFESVSEIRANILTAESETFSLRVYALTRENPYVADGIKRELTTRTEFYLKAPSYEKNCAIEFYINQEKFGGDMSFNNVKGEYYFSCALDSASLQNLECSITYGEQTTALSARSVLTSDTLSPKAVLKALIHSNKPLFDAMTDEYGFCGEIYLRLIYEDAPFYYVGVVDRAGKICAFLLSAQTGKVLAKREK